MITLANLKRKRTDHDAGSCSTADEPSIGAEPTWSEPRMISPPSRGGLLSIYRLDTAPNHRYHLRPNNATLDDVWLVPYEGNNPLYILKDSWVGFTRPEKELRESRDALSLLQNVPVAIDSLCDDALGMRTSKLNEGQTVVDDMQQRRHHRLLPGEYGLPLAEFGTIRELLTVFMDTIQAHRDMLDAASLHRDISLQNVMISDDAKPGGRSGLLIDLDYAVTYPRVNVPNGDSLKAHRTGTLAFMAHELLLDTTSTLAHQPYHDLQSFFFVLLWICVTLEGPGRHRLTDFAFSTTQIGSWMASNVAKKMHMIDTKECMRLVGEFHPYFDGLKALVDPLRRLLLRWDEAEYCVTSRTEVTHDELHAAFREERDKLDSENPIPPEGVCGTRSTIP